MHNHTHMHNHTRTRTHTDIRIYICIYCIDRYSYIYIYSDMHIYMYTQIIFVFLCSHSLLTKALFCACLTGIYTFGTLQHYLDQDFAKHVSFGRRFLQECCCCIHIVNSSRRSVFHDSWKITQTDETEWKTTIAVGTIWFLTALPGGSPVSNCGMWWWVMGWWCLAQGWGQRWNQILGDFN